ncbi:MAG: hypothetical protein H0W77_04735, partial [Acidobacteria bacterium]|nr:hypothetical protein [Acidobacteriota bacterium]
MKKILMIIAFLFLFQTIVQAQNPPLVFKNVTVIDMTGKPLQAAMTVVIEGNSITKIGTTAKTKIPKNAQVIDASGKFLIPGLWDMHVHLQAT